MRVSELLRMQALFIYNPATILLQILFTSGHVLVISCDLDSVDILITCSSGLFVPLSNETRGTVFPVSVPCMSLT